MTITLRPPAFSDWTCATGSLSPVGTSIVAANVSSMITCTVNNLVPGMPLRVQVTISADGPNPLIVIGSTTKALSGKYQTMIVNVTPATGSVEINISGATTATVYNVSLMADLDLPEDARPAQVLSLQAFFPLRGLEGFRLDTSRFGRDALTRGLPAPAAFTLDRDALNTQRLYYKNVNVAWQDITSPTTAMKVTRGINATGPVYTAQAGTLTVTALDALDPRETGLTYATPVMLLHWPTRTPLFTGTVTGIEVTRHAPDAAHAYSVTFTISDAVRRLSSVKRYGARAEGGDGSETWQQRITRLMRSAPDVPYTITATTYQKMCATVWETSLAKHLDAAVASVTGSWIVNRDGSAIFSSARPARGPLLFSDTQQSDGQTIFAYTAIESAWSTGNIVSAVNATNHGAHIADNEWRALDTSITVSEETYAQTWSGSAASVDLTCIDTNAATSAARALIDQATDTPTPQNVTIRPAHAYGPINATRLMEAATTLDPLTPATVENRGDTAHVIITEVTHTITAEEWETIISFTPQR